MPAPSLPELVAVGARIMASTLNEQLRSCLQWLMTDAPTVRALGAAPQTIPTGTWTSVLVPSADAGGSEFFGSTTSRLLLGQAPGWWLVWGVTYWDAPTTGTRRNSVIALNGNHVPGSYGRGEPGNPGVSQTPPVVIDITSSSDYVEMQSQHDAPASVPTLVDASRVSALHAVFLRTL